MKILAVIPRYGTYGDYYDLPVGILYVCACIRDAGHTVRCINLNESDRDVRAWLADEIAAFRPDILCSTAYAIYYNDTQELFRLFKELSPQALTMLGGPLLSSRPELVMNNMPVDIGVVGEGEITTVHLLETLAAGGDLSAVQGIIFHGENGLVQTPARALITDLDSLPMPAYDLIDYPQYLSTTRNNFVYSYVIDNFTGGFLLSSRSCPHRCTFCYHPLGRGKYRKRSMDSIMQEVDFLVREYGINFLTILDDFFAVKRSDILDFCQRVAPYNLKWMLDLRVDDVDAELLDIMREAGCVTILYGIESHNADVLKNMKKQITPESIDRALELTVRHRILPLGNILFGSPSETYEQAMQSLDFAEAHPEYNLSVIPIRAYPASEDYLYCVEKGIITDEVKHLAEGCPLVNMSRMTDEEYAHVMYRARTINQHVNTSRSGYRTLSVTHDDAMHRYLYDFSITCPTCKEDVVYQQYPLFDLERTDLTPLEKYLIICKHCFQRIDIPPFYFDHIRDAFAEKKEQNRELLENLRREQTPVSITPLVPENIFALLGDLCGIDGLNIRNLLDMNSYYTGQQFMGRYPVIPQTAEALHEQCEDDIIIVLPIGRRRQIEEKLRQFGLADDRIITLL